MEYLTGIHALNVPCPLDTCGDWHQAALNWENLTLNNTEDSLLDVYGVFESTQVPDGIGGFKTMYVANTIRALYDLILVGDYAHVQGMRNDFICNEKYTPEVFELAKKFRNTKYWKQVDKVLTCEYELDWITFRGV